MVAEGMAAKFCFSDGNYYICDMDQKPYHNRKNLRAKFHDYSGGDYFVTICTADRQHFFGKIIADEMHHNRLGRHACECFETLASHYDYVEVPMYVVMPNHVHAIIRITDAATIPAIRTVLGVVIGGYKQVVTRYARRNNIEFDWQSRYHDHVIRNNRDGNNIADYIATNPARWSTDCFNR